MIRLIATDIDGTLITPADSDHPRTISPRTLRALEAARDVGIIVVPASGRQIFSIRSVTKGTFLDDGIVLGANGAMAVNLATGECYFEKLLGVEAQTALYEGLKRQFPHIKCVSVREGGEAFVPEFGYVGFMDPGDHGRGEDLPEFPLDEVLGEPSLKLVVRDPGVPEDELLAAALALDVPGCSPVTSGAPFIEVAAGGVDKGSGLAALCGRLGIDAAETVAFGDALNDAAMLAWAGHGVAMGNAVDAVKELADEVTASNGEDGVAQVVERLLREQHGIGFAEDAAGSGSARRPQAAW